MDSNGHAEWRQLEDRKAYVGLPSRHEALGSTAITLITVFMPWVLQQQEKEATEET